MGMTNTPVNPSVELFESTLAYLPEPFVHEPLYGWCARFHRLSGNVIPATTSRQLFGHPVAGLRHDIPSHLDHFQSVTCGRLGSVSDLINQRTQFSFYAPFLDVKLHQAVIEGMRGDDSKSVLQRMGLTRSGLGPMSPLKACRVCIEEDQPAVPSGRWHMEHQWEPTRICLRHQETLLVVSAHLHSGGLKDWYLPKDLKLNAWQPQHSLGPMQFNRLKRIAEWTQALLDRSELRYKGALLRHAYLLQAKAHGWIAMDGTMRLSALRESFARAHEGLDQISGLGFLSRVTDVNGGFLGLLLRQYPGARHPTKHIFLMAHLFAEPEEFFERYREVESTSKAEGLEVMGKQLTNIQTQLREMVGVEGRSINASCQELGIPPAQGVRYVRKEGIPYKHRPRVLTSDKQQKLDDLLKLGAGRSEIAKALAIRTGFIRDYLAENPELRTAWETANEAMRRTEYREHFLKVLQNNPGVPIKRVRRIPGNGFEWLYRNDRDWLAGHLPEIWRR